MIAARDFQQDDADPAPDGTGELNSGALDSEDTGDLDLNAPLMKNPLHEEHLKYEMLRLRSAANIQFGDSTVLSGTFKRSSAVDTPFVPQSVAIPVIQPDTLRRLADLPREHPSRMRLDTALYGEVEKIREAFADGPGELSSCVITLPVNERASIMINLGYGDTIPYYMVLADDLVYQVTEGFSSFGKVRQPANVALTLDDEINQRFLACMPSLSELIKLQHLSGHALRSELSELSQELRSYLSGFAEDFSKLLKPTDGELTRIEKVHIDVPRDGDDKGTAEVILSLNKLYELQALIIVG